MSSYPYGTPGTGVYESDLWNDQVDFTPDNAVSAIIDNHTPVNRASLRNSIGKEIALVQNFVNSTYLGREDTHIESGFLNHLTVGEWKHDLSEIGDPVSSLYNLHTETEVESDNGVLIIQSGGGTKDEHRGGQIELWGNNSELNSRVNIFADTIALSTSGSLPAIKTFTNGNVRIGSSWASDYKLDVEGTIYGDTLRGDTLLISGGYDSEIKSVGDGKDIILGTNGLFSRIILDTSLILMTAPDGIFVRSLPTEKPGYENVLWNSGGYVCIS